MTPAEKAKQDVLQAERRARALNMRRDGRTYEAIGVELGITPQSAYDMVKRALTTMVREPADETIKLERERLDMLLTAAVDRLSANVGDPELNEKTTATILNIMARRAKLDGLDAPTRVTVKEEAPSKLTDAQLVEAAKEAIAVLSAGKSSE